VSVHAPNPHFETPHGLEQRCCELGLEERILDEHLQLCQPLVVVAERSAGVLSERAGVASAVNAITGATSLS
jgi:hypothetical protein